MEFKRGNNSIYLGESEANHQAIIEYTLVEDGLINVYHTGVKRELEGQGIAGKLVDELAKLAKEENFKVSATCSYAKAKFEKKYPELVK